MNLAIQTEPTYEPIGLEEAKAHCVIEHDEDNALLETMITAVRRHVEVRCNRALVRQKWRLYMDYGFSEFNLLPYKVQEVEGIYYLDTDGTEQTLATSVYTADIPRQRVYLAYNQSWPATRYVRNAIWCDVWAGEYKAEDSPVDVTGHIPQDLKNAMLLMISDIYENRGKSSDMQLFHNATYDALLNPHVVYA